MVILPERRAREVVRPPMTYPPSAGVSQGGLYAPAKVLRSETQEAQGRDRDEVRAQPDELGDAGGIGGGVAPHPDQLAAGPDPGNDLAHEFPHRRGAGVAHALTEI